MSETTKKYLDASGLDELVKQIATVASNLSTKIKNIEDQVNQFITPDDVDSAFEPGAGDLPRVKLLTYNIGFKDSGGDEDSEEPITSMDSSDKITDVVNVASIVDADNVYLAKTGNGLKFGTEEADGSLTFNLNSEVKVSKFEVIAKAYDEDGDVKKGAISVNDVEGYLDSSSFKQIILELNASQPTSQIKIDVSARQACIKELIIYFESPMSLLQ